MGVIKRFFGVPDDSPIRSQQESVTDAPAQEYTSAHSSAPEPTHLRQSQHVLDDASHYLADFAVSVPPRALIPAFEMVETYRKITAETGSDTRAALPSTTEYTLQTALTTYVPNLLTVYTRTHNPTPEQTSELVQALTDANQEFVTALNLVRADNSLELETHTLFMRKRMAV